MNTCTPSQVQEAFLAGAPLISSNIIDLTLQHPSWLRDLPQYEEWPLGAGTIMEQLIFRGQLPQIERGMDAWRKINNISGCNPCPGPDCSYNWSELGGHSWERKLTELMDRDFKSPQYCISEIQTTAHFKEVFAKIVENLYRQIDFFKEMNIAHNFLTGLAKKFVVDSEGPKINKANPYVYRNIGTTELSMLNIDMLEFFYENMRRIPDVVPFDVTDGAPIYALECSHQLLARLYRDDDSLRQDVRFSGLANDMLMKYNFMSTIRGMFIPAPILYPRRFNRANGVVIEVLPFVNNVPGEVGSYTGLNPAYESAELEEVLIHGKHPFKIMYMPTATTLGEGTSFGPEFSFMNSWAWINPLTNTDPFRRVGFFATSAKIGLNQQFSEGIFAILVTRPTKTLMAKYQPRPSCAPDSLGCDNVVPDDTCPCPLVLDIRDNPMTADRYYFYFATPVEGEALDTVQFELSNGGYITGTLQDISADGLVAEVSFAAGTVVTNCGDIVAVFCENTLSCSSEVICANDCRSGETGQVKLTLKNAIKADTVNDVIVACFGDGTTANLTVEAINMSALEWSVSYAAGFGPTDDPEGEGETVLSADMVCDRQGIIKVCVPTATDASCPSCTVAAPVACTNPEEEIIP